MYFLTPAKENLYGTVYQNHCQNHLTDITWKGRRWNMVFRQTSISKFLFIAWNIRPPSVESIFRFSCLLKIVERFTLQWQLRNIILALSAAVLKSSLQIDQISKITNNTTNIMSYHRSVFPYLTWHLKFLAYLQCIDVIKTKWASLNSVFSLIRNFDFGCFS